MNKQPTPIPYRYSRKYRNTCSYKYYRRRRKSIMSRRKRKKLFMLKIAAALVIFMIPAFSMLTFALTNVDVVDEDVCLDTEVEIDSIATSLPVPSLQVVSIEPRQLERSSFAGEGETEEQLQQGEEETQEPETETEEVEEEPVLTQQEILDQCIGQSKITIDDTVLTSYDLPSAYYSGLDFSYMQPFMDYRCITDKSSPAYEISYSDKAYTDENGLRRYKTSEDQFTINGNDDYIVALGTFYKPKGQCGLRYLVVTSTGMYTIITGDEKDDGDTDKYNMFSYHEEYVAIIEWIVDTKNLNHDIKYHGTVSQGPVEALQGDILYIYRID